MLITTDILIFSVEISIRVGRYRDNYRFYHFSYQDVAELCKTIIKLIHKPFTDFVFLLVLIFSCTCITNFLNFLRWRYIL